MQHSISELLRSYDDNSKTLKINPFTLRFDPEDIFYLQYLLRFRVTEKNLDTEQEGSTMARVSRAENSKN